MNAIQLLLTFPQSTVTALCHRGTIEATTHILVSRDYREIARLFKENAIIMEMKKAFLVWNVTILRDNNPIQPEIPGLR